MLSKLCWVSLSSTLSFASPLEVHVQSLAWNHIFNELKTEQKKVTTLEGELKTTKEELISEHATLVEERKSIAMVKDVATEELVAAHAELNKT